MENTEDKTSWALLMGDGPGEGVKWVDVEAFAARIFELGQEVELLKEKVGLLEVPSAVNDYFS